MELDVLNKFEELITDNIAKQSEIECLQDELKKRDELLAKAKEMLLEANYDDFKAKYYRSEMLDYRTSNFAMKDTKRMLEIGITYDEMIDYIKAVNGDE